MQRQVALQVRQGDVYLVPSSDPAFHPPVGALTRVLPSVAGRHILALGEATGHHHSVMEDAGTLALDGRGVAYLTIEQVIAPLEHQEHGAIPLSPELYEVVHPYEWTDASEPLRSQD